MKIYIKNNGAISEDNSMFNVLLPKGEKLDFNIEKLYELLD